MKKLIGIVLSLLFILMTITPAYANSDAINDKYNATSITLNKTELEFNGMGSHYKLEADIQPASYDKSIIYWNSTNKKVVSVDSEGVVVPVGVGTAMVYAETANGKRATCKVTVNSVEAKGVTVYGPKNIYMGDGEYYVISYNPWNTTQRNITVTSSKEDIVYYPTSFYGSSNFRIAAKNVGTTTITVSLDNGVSTSFDITVKPVLATGLMLNYSSLNLYEGQTSTITYEVFPKNTTNKTLTWQSSNPDVVKVDSKGRVQAIKEGSATISASTSNGIVRSVDVEVSPYKVSSISLNRTNLTMDIGKSERLEAKVYPIEAKNKEVIWKSSNSLIVSVDQNGVVRANNGGEAIIKAISKDNGNIVSECIVKVNKVKTQKIELNKDYVEFNSLTTSTTLTGNILPYNAHDKTIKWSSTNEKVVKVSGGVVTPVGEGSALIKAETVDGHVDYCSVGVKLPKQSVVGNKPSTSNNVVTTSKKKITVGKVNSLKIKSGKKSATITISKASNAKYYEIYRSTNKSKGFKKVATVKSTKYVNKKLTSKKTYYYKVRAVNGSTKGSFSKVYKVKVK